MRIENTSSQQSGNKNMKLDEVNDINEKQQVQEKEQLKNEENEQINIITEEEIIEAIESSNEEMMIYDRRFEFSIHEGTKEIMVKIIDAETEKVVKEIPPEKILDMVAKMWEMVGLFVDEKV